MLLIGRLAIERVYLLGRFTVSLMEKSIKYLGCGIPSRLNNTFHLNYDPPIQNIKEYLNGWKHITVSWIGCINTLKMNVLPRISYLFHQLPVDVPEKQFRGKPVKEACVIFCVQRYTTAGWNVLKCGYFFHFIPLLPVNYNERTWLTIWIQKGTTYLDHTPTLYVFLIHWDFCLKSFIMVSIWIKGK